MSLVAELHLRPRRLHGLHWKKGEREGEQKCGAERG
jgi:hypothetical protein